MKFCAGEDVKTVNSTSEQLLGQALETFQEAQNYAKKLVEEYPQCSFAVKSVPDFVPEIVFSPTIFE